jgi:hypothetical protein
MELTTGRVDNMVLRAGSCDARLMQLFLQSLLSLMSLDPMARVVSDHTVYAYHQLICNVVDGNIQNTRSIY